MATLFATPWGRPGALYEVLRKTGIGQHWGCRDRAQGPWASATELYLPSKGTPSPDAGALFRVIRLASTQNQTLRQVQLPDSGAMPFIQSAQRMRHPAERWGRRGTLYFPCLQLPARVVWIGAVTRATHEKFFVPAQVAWR